LNEVVKDKIQRMMKILLIRLCVNTFQPPVTYEYAIVVGSIPLCVVRTLMEESFNIKY
jgi:hypothetical protein